VLGESCHGRIFRIVYRSLAIMSYDDMIDLNAWRCGLESLHCNEIANRINLLLLLVSFITMKQRGKLSGILPDKHLYSTNSKDKWGLSLGNLANLTTHYY
jgi:hypothetical protein